MFAKGPGDQVESYQRFKKWYLMPPYFTLSIVKWSNPGNGVVPSSTLQCCSCWEGSLRVTLDYGHQLYFTYCSKHVSQFFFISFAHLWYSFFGILSYKPSRKKGKFLFMCQAESSYLTTISKIYCWHQLP